MTTIGNVLCVCKGAWDMQKYLCVVVPIHQQHTLDHLQLQCWVNPTVVTQRHAQRHRRRKEGLVFAMIVFQMESQVCYCVHASFNARYSVLLPKPPTFRLQDSQRHGPLGPPNCSLPPPRGHLAPWQMK